MLPKTINGSRRIYTRKLYNQFKGRFCDIDIERNICRDGYTHGGKRHFEAGESKCRICNLFFKVTWMHNFCPQCGKQLAHSSRYRNRDRYAVAY